MNTSPVPRETELHGGCVILNLNRGNLNRIDLNSDQNQHAPKLPFSTWRTLTHIILAILHGSYNYHCNFMDKEIEARRH